MTITKKITLGFALPIAVLLAVGGLFRSVTTRLEDTASWVDHSNQITDLVQQTLTRMVDAETGARAFFLVGKEEFLEPYLGAQADVTRLVDEAGRLSVDNPEQHGRLERLRTTLVQRLNIVATAIDARRKAPFDDATAVATLAAGKVAMDAVRTDLGTIRETELGLLAKRRAAASDSAENAQLALVVALAIGILLSMLSSYLIARSVIGPLAVVREGVDRIGGGDLEYRIVIGNRDELGQLAAAFNAMAGNRSKAEAEIVKRSDERARVLERVGEIASRLAASAGELQATTASQASGAQQQSAAVAETTTIVEEVVQTSAQAAERAHTVAEVARQAVEAGEAGHESLDSATATMTRARDQANRVAESILSLAEQAQSIEEIIASVDDLSEQSNMLALNAAIEAARAGEQGRGFAVVANEMKALAEGSKAATVQVRRILGTIQKQSNQAVMMTEASTRGLGEAAVAATAVGSTMRTLNEAIATAAQSVGQIAASARQQSGGLQQINQAMRDVSAVATQNLATTRQVGEAARDLSELGSSLKEIFAELPVGRGDGRA